MMSVKQDRKPLVIQYEPNTDRFIRGIGIVLLLIILLFILRQSEKSILGLTNISLASILALPVVLFAAIYFFTLPNVYTFDSPNRKFIIHHRTLLGQYEKQYPFSDIQAILLFIERRVYEGEVSCYISLKLPRRTIKLSKAVNHEEHVEADAKWISAMVGLPVEKSIHEILERPVDNLPWT